MYFQDRARLVFHAWVLPTGQICGNGPRYRDTCKSMANDREIYLNELPIGLGYRMELVFGKCIYEITVEDVLAGLTDEQDLIWVSRKLGHGVVGTGVVGTGVVGPYDF